MEVRFHIADYLVMGVVLLISLSIGVYFGLIKRQRTPEEYLLGNRQMQLLPVALSMIVTYQSAISVIGVPTEIYLYHTMYLYTFVGYVVCVVVQLLTIVPLMYPLRLSSAYEYLGRRFDSRVVQLMGTVLGMLKTLLYMSVVLLAPALSLEAVSGLPLWLSIVLVGTIGTVYTSLGGIKSVIWTDVFQFIILYAGLVTIFILSIIKLGSFNNIWSLAESGNRIVFDITSVDPRVRHTVWGCLLGGFFNWLPNICNQSAVQRICSMKTMKQTKIAVLLNIPAGIIFVLVLTLLGLIIYAYFANSHCDPLASGDIKNANEITPYFVMHILTDVPGLAGLFIAVLFSGSLSTLSSGINSMSANTIEDLLVNYLNNTSQWKQTLVAKVSVILYGSLAIGLAYLAKEFSGPVTQITNSAMGAIGGPVAGMIFLGGLFPQANWIGAMGGGLAGMVMNLWVSVGSVLYGNASPKSPSVDTAGCHGNDTLAYSNSNITILSSLAFTISSPIQSTSATASGELDHLALYDISYQYFGLLGFLVTIIIGLLLSVAKNTDEYVTEPEHIFPFVRGLWKRFCGGKLTKGNPISLRKETEVHSHETASAESPVLVPLTTLD